MTRSVAASLVFLLSCASGEQPAPDDAEELRWPRTFRAGGDEVLVYDPQVVSWEDFETLKARSAVAVRPAGASRESYGVIEYTVATDCDAESRQVLLKNRSIQAVRFSGVPKGDAASLEAVLRRALDTRPTLRVSLDFLLAYIQDAARSVRSVEVNLEPPPIYASERPAVLVQFLGSPEFKPVPGTSLRFAVNTNWDVLHDPAAARYFLLHGEGWLSAPDVLRGPWTPAAPLPSDFYRLPADDNWSETKKAIPGKRGDAPRVIAATTPSELIVTDGPPVLQPIPGTRLSVVTNTSSDLFRIEEEKAYYFLASGRWFRARDLEGPWSAATKTLPSDFARIPEDHSKADVRASVPGTPEAADAVLLAAVPRRAQVKRKDVGVNVSYEGEPRFESIPSTAVEAAVNSPFSVFKVRGRYYCCHEAVWFEAGDPRGPWSVCASVPSEIYAIPSSHPSHHVTYVRVYAATPDVVEVSYTAGYTGMYVASGMLMFGLGWAMAYDDDWYYRYPSHWYGYGCGARYSWTSGTYYNASRVYGPYGGAGFGAGYNPATGNYVRGAAAYGPYGERYAARSYNPATGTSRARGGVSTPYGSWERGVAVRGDEWARGGVRRDERGAVAGAETSRGGRALGVENPAGERAGVARSGSGDLYAGRDGEVYRRSSDGWQTYSNGQWSDTASRERAKSDTMRSLQSDAGSRDRGHRTSSQVQRSAGARPARGGRR